MFLVKSVVTSLPPMCTLILLQTKHDQDGNTTERKTLWIGDVKDFPILKEDKGYLLGLLYGTWLECRNGKYIIITDVDEVERMKALERYFSERAEQGA